MMQICINQIILLNHVLTFKNSVVHVDSCGGVYEALLFMFQVSSHNNRFNESISCKSLALIIVIDQLK